MNILFNIIKISSITCIVKIIGFIKDIVIANKFGINMTTDSFYSSLKIQNLLRKILTEGTLSYIFIPILSKYKIKKKKKKIQELISSIYVLLTLTLFIITIFCIYFSKKIIYLTSYGFIKNYKKFNLTNKLFKKTIPFIILISLSYFLASILNLWNIIYPIISIPLITNINMIIFTLFISKYFKNPILSLTSSIITGGIIQITIQNLYIKKIKILLKIKNINIYNIKLIKIIKKIIPTIFGISLYHISHIINNNILSFLKEGSISWIYYADRIIELPISILGTITGTVLLAKLSNKYNKKDIKGYNKIINKYIQIILKLSIPISIFFIITSKLLIITLFNYGKFKYIDVIMTSKILIINSISLIGLILTKIFIPCYYSQQNIRTPNNISIIILIITQILNIFTIKLFKYKGISISNCISSYINTFLLYKYLKNKKIFKKKYKWKKFLIKIIISNLITLILLIISTKIIEKNFIYNNIYIRLIKILFLILFNIIIYINNLNILKINK